MMLGQPGYNVDILGDTWEYQNDNWGETVACSDYIRKSGTERFLEQCFSINDGPSAFDDQVTGLTEQGFEILIPQTAFNETEQTSLLGMKVEGESNKLAIFIEMIGAVNYISLVELHVAADNDAALQTIYERWTADIIDYVLRDSLQKSRILPAL